MSPYRIADSRQQATGNRRKLLSSPKLGADVGPLPAIGSLFRRDVQLAKRFRQERSYTAEFGLKERAYISGT